MRKMEYVFPKENLAGCNDQFMLGDSIMVAPMTSLDDSRTIVFPKGTWKGDDGSTIKGPAKKTIKVELERLPWFRLIRK